MRAFTTTRSHQTPISSRATFGSRVGMETPRAAREGLSSRVARNLRPSGYEPSDLAFVYSLRLPRSTADKAIRATFVTSCVVLSRAVRKHTAEFTAPRAMQRDVPRCVTPVRRNCSARYSDCRRGVCRHIGDAALNPIGALMGYGRLSRGGKERERAAVLSSPRIRERRWRDGVWPRVLLPCQGGVSTIAARLHIERKHGRDACPVADDAPNVDRSAERLDAVGQSDKPRNPAPDPLRRRRRRESIGR
jgi:hypothetical protein